MAISNQEYCTPLPPPAGPLLASHVLGEESGVSASQSCSRSHCMNPTASQFTPSCTQVPLQLGTISPGSPLIKAVISVGGWAGDILVLLSFQGCSDQVPSMPAQGLGPGLENCRAEERLWETCHSLPWALHVASLTPADGQGGRGQARAQMRIQTCADAKPPLRTPWLTTSLGSQTGAFSHITGLYVPGAAALPGQETRCPPRYGGHRHGPSDFTCPHAAQACGLQRGPGSLHCRLSPHRPSETQPSKHTARFSDGETEAQRS